MHVMTPRSAFEIQKCSVLDTNECDISWYECRMCYHGTRLHPRFVAGLEAYHGGGSGPPRNRGMGRWGWGAGGDGGGDGGEEGRGHVESAGDLTALGAAQVRYVFFTRLGV